MNVPAEEYRLSGISPKAYEHPADRAATAALASIPMLETVVRKLIEFGYERALQQNFLGASVRIGPDQLPDIYTRWQHVIRVLDLDRVPDLYLTQWPLATATTVGADKPIVVLNSATVSLLDGDQLETVLAQQACHILSEHVAYHTALTILLRLGTSVLRLPLLAGLPMLGVQYALLEWYRAAELSSDRGATLVTRDPRLTSATLLAFAAGDRAADLNIDAFLRQAQDYTEHGNGFDRLQRLITELGRDEPLAVKRVHELMLWIRSGEYDRVISGEYPRRGEPRRPARAEAGDAIDHYTERFKNLIRDAGEQVGSAGQQVGDWLRGRDE